MSDDINSILGVSEEGGTASSPSSLLNRYRDAYLVATSAVGFSGLIKALGWIIAIIIWITGFIFASQQRGDGGGVYAIAGIISGTVQLIVFYFFGVIVGAIGQILRATLDTAVHSSPFLDEQQKSQAMRL